MSAQRQQAFGLCCTDHTDLHFAMFQTRMETTFGPAYPPVTTITKGECIPSMELLPKALAVISNRSLVVLQLTNLLAESLFHYSQVLRCWFQYYAARVVFNHGI